ncbi:unnamed protein product [Rotaria sp. Silwood1]|nr:unnamed protein product [Rotaria sp. Silwood1]
MHLPSICFTFLILHNFKWNRLASQIFGILLIVNALLILFELPFTLTYLYDGFVRHENICPVWILINYSLFILSIILIAWTSIERYLFIYHEQLITRCRILLHYIPIGCFIVYTPLFYISLVLFYPCQQAFNEYSYICGGPCYLFHIVPCVIDWLFNVVLVLLITCVMNIILIVVNIKQRYKMKKSIITVGNSQRWRRTIKLSVQVFSISTLCVIGWIPYGVVSTIQLFHNTEFLSYLLSTFFIYFPYIQTLFLPYVCLLFMPKIKNKVLIIVSHEHQNHIDPVTAKYSQSAINVDPLNQHIESTNIQKTEFQQPNDDEHLDDTIEARLQTKHNLRQSVHQQSDDDKFDNEQDYINRLNSALENEYKKEPESQHVASRIADTIHNAPSQNQIKEDVQVPSRIVNETISIQTPKEQHTTNEASPIIDTLKHAQNLDEKLSSKLLSNEITDSARVQTNEQQPTNIIEEKVIKEDIPSIHKETLSSTQSHQQNEKLNVVKPIINHIPPSADQQQPISNTIINHTVQDNSSIDVKPSSPTPSQLDQTQQLKSDTIQNVNSLNPKLDQQQPISEAITNDHPLDSTLKQQRKFDTIQNADSSDYNPSSSTSVNEQQKQQVFDSIHNFNSVDPRPDHQQSVHETIKNDHTLDSTLKQQQTSDTIQNVVSSDHYPSSSTSTTENQKQQVPDSIQNVHSSNQQQPSLQTKQHVSSLDQQQQTLETMQNIDSIDHHIPPIQVDHQSQVIDATKQTESIRTNVKSDDISSERKESPTNVRASTPSARILRSATTRMTQTAQARHRHIHSNQETIAKQQEPEKTPATEDLTIETKSSSTTMATIESTLSSTTISTVESIKTVTPESTLSSTMMTTTIESTLSSTTMSTIESPKAATIESTLSSTTMSTVESSNIATMESTLPSTIMPITEQSIEDYNNSVESSLLKPQEPQVETVQQLEIDLNINEEAEIQINQEYENSIDITDLPRQVHVHDPKAILNNLEEETNKNEKQHIDKEIDSHTTIASFLSNDHSPHLPRVLENKETASTIESTIETMTNTVETIDNKNEINQPLTYSESKVEETNNTQTSKLNTISIASISNNSEKALSTQYRQVCWNLPPSFEPTFELIENRTLRFVKLLPEFVQITLYEYIDDDNTIINAVWLGSICSMCLLFSFLFLSLGTKRLQQSKQEKKIRAHCQQLRQYNNQIELERATFEKQNQELSDQIDELKKIPVCDADEELFELREKYERLHAEWKIARNEHDILQNDINYKNSVIQKSEVDMQKQLETIAFLNDEIFRQKQELEKERQTIIRPESTDLSLERFQKLEEIIHQLKSEITQLKQEKFTQFDQLEQVQERANQLDIDNNELTIKMKQLKDLLQQRDETIAQIREKMLNSDDDDEEKTTEIGNLLSTAKENTNDNDQKELLSNINNDIEKANQHMRSLHSEIDEKTRRIKELDALLNQEKDHCKELETKLKVVLELRERDAHLHIRQLGQTDAELRKARTDTERVRILQQQLELKQKQLDDVQKVLSSEQTKFSEESGKLQHEIHEKWMEVKRLTRELDGARKECEGLRRQITRYANSERLSQEKTMHKPIPQHINNSSRLSSEPETNSSSPPPSHSYQQGEKPIDYGRNDSGAASPAEMLRIRPPLFGLPRPPFFPPPFMPPPNPFMMGPRFPMPVGGPHGMISPISHLITNGSGGGSDANSFEIVDSINVTPNSTSYDTQLNGSAVSPIPNGKNFEQNISLNVI